MVKSNKLRAQYILVDWMTTAVAFLLFNIYRYFHLTHGADGWDGAIAYVLTPKLLTEEIVTPLLMLGVYWLTGYYHDPFQRSRAHELSLTVVSAIVNTLLIYLALLTNDQIEVSSRNYATIGMLFGLLFGCTYMGRLTVTSKRIRMIREQRWKFPTLVLGTRQKSAELTAQLQSSLANLGYSVEAYILTDNDNHPDTFEGKPVYCLKDVSQVCHEHHITQILVALPQISDDQLLEMLSDLFILDIPVKISPNLQDYLTSAISLTDIYGEPFVDITKTGMSPGQLNIKRTIDVILSSLALVVIAPISLLIAWLIKRDSRGPVFYRQTRIGRHRKPFTIYKFRTMRTDAEASGPQLSSDHDTRITSCGRFLRKYRLDELPQFWNVLKGDMSIVGPRPEREYYINQILQHAPYYMLLHRVRPGITSWGMVKYGYASDIDQMIERVRYDLLYLSNMSVTLDLKILIYTVRTVLLGKGK